MYTTAMYTTMEGIGLAHSLTYFDFAFKYRLMLPLACQLQVCSTKSNHP